MTTIFYSLSFSFFFCNSWFMRKLGPYWLPVPSLTGWKLKQPAVQPSRFKKHCLLVYPLQACSQWFNYLKNLLDFVLSMNCWILGAWNSDVKKKHSAFMENYIIKRNKTCSKVVWFLTTGKGKGSLMGDENPTMKFDLQSAYVVFDC